MPRIVTEEDFRMPEFRRAKPEDYEFRDDGKLVRKDRWEQGIHSIRSCLGMNGREFEISDVVDAVRKLAPVNWVPVTDELPPEGVPVDICVGDGSTLCNVTYFEATGFYWEGSAVNPIAQVTAWRKRGAAS
jgi:hypothetical protein